MDNKLFSAGFFKCCSSLRDLVDSVSQVINILRSDAGNRNTTIFSQVDAEILGQFLNLMKKVKLENRKSFKSD